MKYIIIGLLLGFILFLVGCTGGTNDMVGGIFNGIWSSKLTPYVIIGIIIFYVIQKRSSGGK
jgi:ABC-type microcin C transport system permease subunit YejE